MKFGIIFWRKSIDCLSATEQNSEPWQWKDPEVHVNLFQRKENTECTIILYIIFNDFYGK
jgi:hypothetical protein